MTKQNRTKYQIIGLMTLSLMIAAGTVGFARAEAVGTTGFFEVGYGVQSDYQVSRISYTLDEKNPTDFLAVSFSLDQSVSTVQAGISDSKSDQIIWADNCDFNGHNWVCSFGSSYDVRLANWLYIE